MLQTLSQGFPGIAQQLLSYHTIITTTSQKPGHARVAVALGQPPDIVDQNGKLTASRDITGSVVNAVAVWFAAEDNNRWLLIIDNYDGLRSVNIYAMTFSTQAPQAAPLSQIGPKILVALGKHLKSRKSQKMMFSKYSGKSARSDMASFEKGMNPPHLILPDKRNKGPVGFR